MGNKGDTVPTWPGMSAGSLLVAGTLLRDVDPGHCVFALAAVHVFIVLSLNVTKELWPILVLGLSPYWAGLCFWLLLVGGTACILGNFYRTRPGLWRLRAIETKALGYGFIDSRRMVGGGLKIPYYGAEG